MAKITKYRISTLVPYGDVLYFLEILYLMITLLFLYGKLVAVIAGAVLAVLLSIHIILLAMRKNTSRIIQLVIMELHCAYCVPYILNALFVNAPGSPLDTVFVMIRSACIVCELAALYVLTDEEVRPLYVRG